MSELVKTSIYVGAALLISAVAFFSRPQSIGLEKPDMEGSTLFADFEDPYVARSMKIVRYDEGLGKIDEFEVAQVADRWVIPSHNDYPADAETQLKDAATSMIGLTVIGVPSLRSGDHELYGVIQPSAETTEVGEQGVGMLVAMQDADENDLATLIIGKEVKDAEGQRYVRIPGEDPVYTVKIDPTKFSTKFEDWIEKDLLDLSSFDIKQVTLRDYSLNVGLGGAAQYEQRLEMGVTWNADDFKWELDDLREWQNGQLSPSTLGDDEELNKETLDGLKDALDELQIVDVEKKPAGLRADLRAEEDFMTGAEAQQSLGQRGFYVVMMGPDRRELLSSDGEVLVRTKDGVEYVMRFGGYPDQLASGSKESGAELNRYVFVTARVDEGNFPPPEYESLPDEEGDPTPPAPLSQTDEPSTSDATESSEDTTPEETGNGESAADESAAEETAAEGGDDSSPDSEEEKADETTETTETESDTEAAADGESDPDAEDERDRIIKENERKRKEYDEKRKTAEDKVRDLNFRFADWYYVISENVYKKIHLGRTDVVKKKEKTDEEQKQEVDEGFEVDAFRKIEEAGLAPAESEDK